MTFNRIVKQYYKGTYKQDKQNKILHRKNYNLIFNLLILILHVPLNSIEV